MLNQFGRVPIYDMGVLIDPNLNTEFHHKEHDNSLPIVFSLIILGA